MQDFLSLLSPAELPVFTAAAEYTFSLGYRAKRDLTKDLNYSFFHRQVKPLIMRFSLLKGQLVIRLKFFAANYYSRFFEDALKATIEEYDFKYIGCYGCDKCDGRRGYTIRYLDRREYFRCGLELIELPGLKMDQVPELLDLFHCQYEYYLG